MFDLLDGLAERAHSLNRGYFANSFVAQPQLCSYFHPVRHALAYHEPFISGPNSM